MDDSAEDGQTVLHVSLPSGLLSLAYCLQIAAGHSQAEVCALLLREVADQGVREFATQRRYSASSSLVSHVPCLLSLRTKGPSDSKNALFDCPKFLFLEILHVEINSLSGATSACGIMSSAFES